MLALWLALYYKHRLEENYQSLIGPLVCVLVYLLGLLAWNTPQWFVAAMAVLIIFFLNAKPRIRAFADTVTGAELATVAKFVIMAVIVLPLLPDSQIAPFIPVTYRQTWLAVVAVSGISYFSYMAQNYVFKAQGTLVAGILGGLYSSTATTFVLGSRAREAPGNTLISPALILATAMMYVRLLVLAAVLAPVAADRLALPFISAAVLSGLAALTLVRLRGSSKDSAHPAPDRHPLEFRVALLFAVLFVLFSMATQFIVGRYSGSGLEVMAFLVGFTDIDPFVLSVLTGHMDITLRTAVGAVVIATASNNLLKAVFALGIARNRSVVFASGWLVLLALAAVVYVVLWL